MESIQLRLGEANEITFSVNVKASRNVRPVYRFICEGRDMSYSVDGSAADGGEVSFVLPPLQEGQVADETRGRLEVIIEDRLYIPMQVGISFERPTSVVAETVTVRSGRQVQEESVSVTARTKPQARSAPAAPNSSQKGRTLREMYDKQRKR